MKYMSSYEGSEHLALISQELHTKGGRGKGETHSVPSTAVPRVAVLVEVSCFSDAACAGRACSESEEGDEGELHFD
jgi:hypothetical protein